MVTPPGRAANISNNLEPLASRLTLINTMGSIAVAVLPISNNDVSWFNTNSKSLSCPPEETIHQSVENLTANTAMQGGQEQPSHAGGQLQAETLTSGLVWQKGFLNT